MNTTVIELAGSESLGHDSRQHQASTAQKTVVTIGLAVFAGRFRYVEVLFLRTTMVAIFVLSGGTTRFKGVGERAALAFEFPVRNTFTVGAKRFRCKEDMAFKAGYHRFHGL